MRRVLILTSSLIFIDLLFFSLLTPLLPTYVRDLGLNKSQAGVLGGAYAWGSVFAALPAGFFAQRFGPRPVVCVGLLLLSTASVVVGWVSHIAILDLARFVQGIAGAVVWSGALTWLVAMAPSDRKGEVVGISVAAGGVGALLGPAVGALAASVGTEWVFTSTLLLTVPLCFVVAFSEDAHQFDHQSIRFVASAIISRPIVIAVILLTVPALAFGFVTVLVPLKVSELGGSAGVIAISFICSGVLETVLAPLSGRWSDRVGRRVPYLSGLALFCFGFAGMAASQSVTIFVAVFLAGTIAAGFFISPGFTILSDAAAHLGLAQSHAFALSNTAFSLGLAVGAFGGGAIANAKGIDSAFLVMVVILVLVALYARRALPSDGQNEPAGKCADGSSRLPPGRAVD
jgi:MFS family permease